MQIKHAPPPLLPALWQEQLAIAGVAFFACVAGILSRPSDFIAIIWPANALLLGLLLRNRPLARRLSTWLLAFAAFAAADLATGSRAYAAFGMNASNMLGVAAGWAYLRRQGGSTLDFRRQHSVLHLLVGSTLAALGSAVPGTLASAHIFGSEIWLTLQRWFAGELFDMLLILPVVLAAPPGWVWRWDWRHVAQPLAGAPRLPFVALLVSLALVYTLNGPGAVG